MPKIEVDVKELVEFIQRCDNDGDNAWIYEACKVCPVRKECRYYFAKNGESGALAGVDLYQ